MSIEVLTVLMLGSFFLLLALGLPFAWVTFSLALLFGLVLQGTGMSLFFIHRTWYLMNNFTLIAIPLFVFMSNILRDSGIVDDLFDAGYHWMGPLRGGLAMATVVANTIVAAMVGMPGAGVVIMGRVALPAMLKRKYDKGIVLGCIMASGGLGMLIPPSFMFIIYGMVSGLSIGGLFMAGIGPGLLLASLYIAYIGIRAYLNPKLAVALPPEERTMPLLQKIALVRTLILPIFLILAVLGSIYLGLATPSEAAGMGAAGAMVCAAMRRRLTWQNVKASVFTSLETIGMVMWVFFGAYAFIGVFALFGGADFIGGLIAGLPFGRWGILVVIMVILLILGMVLDTVGMVILLVPIFSPIIVNLGFDPLWFGILFNLMLQVAFLTPPFGYGLFFMKGVVPLEITMTDIYRSGLFFVGLQLIGVALVIMFPQIALWLPGVMVR